MRGPCTSLVIIALLNVVSPAAAQATAPSVPTDHGAGTQAVGAFVDSLKLLMIEHGIRAFQDKTRRELKGPFWADYRRSVRIPHHWEDNDGWWVNYIGHPIHGAAAGYAWLSHEHQTPPDIGLSPRYWSTRGRAAAWAAVYSLQFEFGPLSEASIGNVGMKPEQAGWVDHVVTPVGAFGLIVAEDALDRFLVQFVERHTTNRVWRASLRMIFNPGRVLANTASGRLPWYRDRRPLDWRQSPGSLLRVDPTGSDQ